MTGQDGRFGAMSPSAGDEGDGRCVAAVCQDPRRRPLCWCFGARVCFPGVMTVLVTRRHVDYVRVTTTGCTAQS
jgi:hypothetical protein